MTEQEAREKWCPMVKLMLGHENHSWQGIAVTNRGETFGSPTDCKCIASDCTMWRFKTNRQMGYDRNPDDLCLSAGYCGLGGKP